MTLLRYYDISTLLLVSPLFELALLDKGFVLDDLHVAEAMEISSETHFDVVVCIAFAEFGLFNYTNPYTFWESIGQSDRKSVV